MIDNQLQPNVIEKKKIRYKTFCISLFICAYISIHLKPSRVLCKKKTEKI